MKSITLLIPLILLSSCTIDWNDEKDKKIANLNTQIEELNRKLDEQKDEIKKVKDDDIFQKNKECAGFLKKLSNEEAIFNEELYINKNEVFYSTKLQTCIYTLLSSRIDSNNSKGINLEHYFLVKNILTNEHLFQQSISTPQKNGDNPYKDYLIKFNKVKDSIR